MAISEDVIGRVLPAIETTVSSERLRFFAEAIGETNPVYIDTEAAKAAGHPDLPLPPTILFGLEFEGPGAFGWISGLGIDMRRVLHGEQEFNYQSVAHAGEALRLEPKITDLYSKKGGALEFLIKETTISRVHDGSAVATAKTVIVVTNPEAAK